MSVSFFTLTLSFARNIAIARLIGPAGFGEFAVAAAVVGVAETLTMPGLHDAVLSRAEVYRKGLHSVWTLILIRGATVTVLLWMFAADATRLLHAPESADALRIMALAPTLRALGSMAPLLALRSVDYRPTMQTTIFGQVVEAAVSVVGVAMTNEPMMIAVGAVVGIAVSSLWSYRFAHYRPRLHLSFSDIQPFLSFARWRWVSQLLVYLSTRADDLVVTRFAGVASLGLYRTAFRLANIATTATTSALGQVAFPALARSLRTNTQEGHRLYERYLTLVAGVAGAAALVFGLAAEGIVLLLLGPDWTGATTPLSIMAAAGFVRAILSAGGSLFLAQERPAIDTAMQFVRVAALFGSLVILIQYGAVGAAWASLISVLLPLPLWLWGLHQTGLPWLSPIRTVANRVVPLLALAMALSAINHAVAEPRVAFLLGTPLGLLLWVSFVLRFDGDLWRELRTMTRRFSATTR